ncbi:MAG: flagellar FlbD family protein [Acidobacteriia bacterium]|nr:flagellar FlbD family protein [Terriglobia bacterium]MBV8902531.1 flagellar FlbD family protein [Terriglobia bacterium]MBV9742555.1 flagellar FlbD family protein [Terriglobia bacterium]
MVRLTRLNQAPIVLNSDLIQRIDITPDTVITLTNGEILRVRESADEVVRRVLDYRRQVCGYAGALGPTAGGPDSGREPEA